nr:hypothetical protein [Mesorhizobium sp.]
MTGHSAPSREWWPDALVDEVMPAGRATPQAWLAPGRDGVTRAKDEDDTEGGVIITLSPGEVLAFVYSEKRGSAEITVMPDGTWKGPGERDRFTIDMFDGPPPPRPEPDASVGDRIAAANAFFGGDENEWMGDTMDEFARNFADTERPGPEGTLTEVDMYFWSPPHWFQVSADGASLSPCAAPEKDAGA